MLTIEVDGVAEAIRELETRASYTEDRGGALITRYGEYTRDLTYQLSPVDTGFMREHVKATIEDSGMGVEVGWYFADFEAEGFAPYYIFQEFGTIHMAAQPSLGPAWNDLEPTFIRDAHGMLRTTMVEGK